MHRFVDVQPTCEEMSGYDHVVDDMTPVTSDGHSTC